MLLLCYRRAKLLVTRLLYLSQPQVDFRVGRRVPTGTKDCAKREQLRFFQTFDWHVLAPAEEVFESPVERLDGLRAQFVKDPPDFHPTIFVRMRTAPRGDPF